MESSATIKKYRHEYKYLISAVQMELLKQRLSHALPRDSHVSTDGKYTGIYNIRSVYFDDNQNTCYWENECGTDPREKFRIRIYNHNDARIQLELKSKCRGMCHKQSCPLTRQQCDCLLSGKPLPESTDYPPLLQKLLLQIATRGLHPVVIVEYDRIPFVFPLGNVRVTLDCHVRASAQCSRLFDETLTLRPILPTGQHILEVKWDEFLPDFIYQALQIRNLRWISFSKFYLCRRFTMQN